MCSIIIADDHPLLLFGMKYFLERKGYDVCGACDNGIEAYNQIITKQPKLALLDIHMPGMTGIEVIEKLNEQRSRTRVIIMTGENDLAVFNKAKKLLIKGYILKVFATEEIEKCLCEVASGGTYFSAHLSNNLLLDNAEANPDQKSLTFAENKILRLVSEQRSTNEIAKMLFISEKTVESHRSNIIKKLNIPGRKNALLMWAMRHM